MHLALRFILLSMFSSFESMCCVAGHTRQQAGPDVSSRFLFRSLLAGCLSVAQPNLQCSIGIGVQCCISFGNVMCRV